MNRRDELIRDLRAERRSAGGDVSGRHVRIRWSLQAFASTAIVGLVLVMLAPPAAPSSAWSVPLAPQQAAAAIGDATQTLTVTAEHSPAAHRDTFEITQIVVTPALPVAPAAGVPDPDSAQAIAYAMMPGYGWDSTQYDCLVALWNRESRWNVYAHNPSSGAYGIPQALPGDKMASAGDDWQTNPATQITWGLGYITARYGTPCGAWAHSEAHNWY